MWKQAPSRLPTDGVHIWRISPSVRARSADWALLSPSECDRAQRFVRDRDKNEWVQCRSWWRRIIARYFGISPTAIGTSSGQFGALRTNPAISQNVSHTAGLALVAVAPSDGYGIGVDVERIRPIDSKELSPLIFSNEERVRFERMTEPGRKQFLFQTWTQKEAWLKALGIGLNVMPHRVQISPGNHGIICSDFAAEALAGWSSYRIDCGVDYAASFAFRGPPPDIHLWLVDEGTF